jgi:hypothetical protein
MKFEDIERLECSGQPHEIGRGPTRKVKRKLDVSGIPFGPRQKRSRAPISDLTHQWSRQLRRGNLTKPVPKTGVDGPKTAAISALVSLMIPLSSSLVIESPWGTRDAEWPGVASSRSDAAGRSSTPLCLDDGQPTSSSEASQTA